MDIKGWKYYNHAAIPAVAPHEEPDLRPIKNKSIWKIENKKPLLARWSTDFDCGYETNWWYVVKDTPFDISAIKSNYRYKINKGLKNFECKRINPAEYIDDIYNVFLEAYKSWPKKYRPELKYEDAETMFISLANNKSIVCYGAFCRETQKLCGFMQVPTSEDYVELQVQRVCPEYEKLQINAALVYCLVSDYANELERGCFYILDGARSINHETAFQDYLEKYFGFRKSYCHLKIEYNPKIKWIIKILYKFRRCFLKFDKIAIIHQINSILCMEEICRNEV